MGYYIVRSAERIVHVPTNREDEPDIAELFYALQHLAAERHIEDYTILSSYMQKNKEDKPEFVLEIAVKHE